MPTLWDQLVNILGITIVQYLTETLTKGFILKQSLLKKLDCFVPAEHY